MARELTSPQSDPPRTRNAIQIDTVCIQVREDISEDTRPEPSIRVTGRYGNVHDQVFTAIPDLTFEIRFTGDAFRELATAPPTGSTIREAIESALYARPELQESQR